MRTPLSVGVVIGAGSGLDAAKVLANDPHVELRWIFHASPAAAHAGRTELPGVSWAARLEQLLDDEELDVIVFAVAPPLRVSALREALKADKHVLVLGLLASSLVEAEALVQIAARRGRHLAAHLACNARPGILRLRSLLDRGALGEIHYLEVSRTAAAIDENEPSLIWSLGAEGVAVVLGLLGDQPIDVHGRSESFVGENPDVFRASLHFATGISAHLSFSHLNAQPIDRVTVVGTRLTAVVDAIHGTDELTLFTGLAEPRQHTGIDEFSLHAGDVLKPILREQDPLRIGCEQFVSAVRSRFEPQTGRDAAAVVGVLEALQRSEAADAAVTGEPDRLNVVHLPF